MNKSADLFHLLILFFFVQFTKLKFRVAITQKMSFNQDPVIVIGSPVTREGVDLSKLTTQETVRRLATVKQIAALEKIEGADQILLARIDGWEVIVKKGEFRAMTDDITDENRHLSDLCVYFEIDSILPKDNPAFAFLEGKRLKQRKMRGVVSQGLALPLTILPPETVQVLRVGDDLTATLGILKWECPLESETSTYVGGGSRGTRRGHRYAGLPAGLIKTGEERAQNCTRVIQHMADKEEDVIVTDKMDGTSTSYYYVPPPAASQTDTTGADPETGAPFSQAQGTFHVCGHNTIRTADDKDSLHYFRMAERYNIEAVLRGLGKAIAVQGEIVSDKICGNTLGLAKGEIDFLVFYIQDLRTGRRWTYDQMLEFCHEYGFTPVPERYRGKFRPEWRDLRVLKKWVHSLVYRPGFPQEGVVIATDNKEGQPRHSFKVISELWLEKWNR